MAVNFNPTITFGSARRGWTAGSISPQTKVADPPISANIGTSGNIPSNIMQAIGNLSAEQAFRNFLGQQVMQQPQPVVMFPPPNPADEIRAKTEQAQQQAAQNAALVAQRQLSIGNQQLLNYPMLAGGMAPMGFGAPRAAIQQRQFGLENQLAQANAAAFGAPRMSGWMGGF